MGTEHIRSGLPGSHPVFLVGNQWVVKFFSDMFGGELSFATEREVFTLLEPWPWFPAARLVAEGNLCSPDGGWRWPYLISTLLPGTSLGEVYEQIGQKERTRLARWLGHLLIQLHGIRLNPEGVLRPDWTPFCHWLSKQRAACVENHRRWQSLPPHLIDQIDDYLPNIDDLVDRSAPPLLLHCDLNADHLLGEFRQGHWTSSGIIDFGDARVGDFHYELGALHLGLFRGDTRLLREFLLAYDSEINRCPDFAYRAMAFTLLHEFNVLDGIRKIAPNLDQIATLQDLAYSIWQQEHPV